MINIVYKGAIALMTRKMKQADEENYAKRKEVKGIKEQKNISYTKDSSKWHMLDMYRPDDDKTYPIFVDIHGGAWVYGTKELNRHFCMHIAKQGFVVYNINYRLLPDADMKGQIQDIFQALDYVIKHAEQDHGDTSQISLGGDSAGAHLAGLATCIMEDEELQKCYGVTWTYPRIHALILQHGIHALAPMRQSEQKIMKTLFRLLFQKGSEHLIDKSCIDELIDKDWKIPIFLLSSKGDETFFPQSANFAKHLQELQLPHEVLFWDDNYPQLHHVFHIAAPDNKESQISIKAMADFMKKQ